MALEIKGEWSPLEMSMIVQELGWLRDMPDDDWIVERCACGAYVVALPAADRVSLHSPTVKGVKDGVVFYYKYGEAQLHVVLNGGSEATAQLMRARPTKSLSLTIAKTA